MGLVGPGYSRDDSRKVVSSRLRFKGVWRNLQRKIKYLFVDPAVSVTVLGRLWLGESAWLKAAWGGKGLLQLATHNVSTHCYNVSVGKPGQEGNGSLRGMLLICLLLTSYSAFSVCLNRTQDHLPREGTTPQ